MKQLITIFKNLGTIVILLFQIAYMATIDYIRPHDNAKNTKNKTASHNTPPSKLGQAWIYSMKDEQKESIERSHKKVDTINEI